ncbi:MAG: sigma-70 family RNA polymerase sigma factor [Acidimicrobiia bacterium]
MTDLAIPGRQPSDDELVCRARTGDASAVGELYERHHDAAQAVARRIARNQDVADDLVADAFARIIDILGRGGGPTHGFRAYLVTSVRNAAFSRSSRSSGTDLGEDALGVALETRDGSLGSPDAGDERDLVARAFLALPAHWREVLWYTVVEHRRPSEVAGTLGMKPNAVAALAYRARDGLRESYLQAHLQTSIDPGCRPIVERLGSHVRGSLGRRERHEVDRHLGACSRCRALAGELRDVNEHLRGLFLPALGVPAGGIVSRLTSRGGDAARHVFELGQVVLTGFVATGAVIAAVVAPAPTQVDARTGLPGTGPAPVETDGRAPQPADPDPAGGSDGTRPVDAPTAVPADLAPAATQPTTSSPATPTTMTAPLPAVGLRITTDDGIELDVTVTLPAVSTPVISTPVISTPELELAGVTVPGIEVPLITVPSITVPDVPAVSVSVATPDLPLPGDLVPLLDPLLTLGS